MCQEPVAEAPLAVEIPCDPENEICCEKSKEEADINGICCNVDKLDVNGACCEKKSWIDEDGVCQTPPLFVEIPCDPENEVCCDKSKEEADINGICCNVDKLDVNGACCEKKSWIDEDGVCQTPPLFVEIPCDPENEICCDKSKEEADINGICCKVDHLDVDGACCEKKSWIDEDGVC